MHFNGWMDGMQSAWWRLVRSRGIQVGLLALMALGSGAVRTASAQVGSERYSAIVIDGATGSILSATNADEPRYPASLTKMMTLYMVFEALRDRRIGLDQPMPVSAHAASMSPSKLGLLPGMPLTVEQAMLGMVTKSANDAAASLGEFLGGDEDRFAQMMTLRARAIGMSRTTFRNASGLPDFNQVTTARDMSILVRHLVQDFPLYYQYLDTPQFSFRGRVIPNHVSMLQTYPGADGGKTGWIEASGHNLALSAVRGGVRLIGIVMGAGSNRERDVQMASMLDQGFDQSGIAPVYVARAEPRFRLPQLIGSAEASERPRVQLAGVQAYRLGVRPRPMIEMPARAALRVTARPRPVPLREDRMRRFSAAPSAVTIPARGRAAQERAVRPRAAGMRRFAG